MKNSQSKLEIAIEHKANTEETVSTMETVIFTEITEKELRTMKMSSFYDMLDYIAFEHNLNCKFSPFFSFGSHEGMVKAQDILINSVKYN